MFLRLCIATVLLASEITFAQTVKTIPTTHPVDWVPLQLTLPKPSTGQRMSYPPDVEPPSDKSGPFYMVPPGTANLALRKPVTSSSPKGEFGELAQITDGDKDGTEGSWIELQPGLQWVQMDLERTCEIHAIAVWHISCSLLAANDVIVQISDDPSFRTGVRTLFNNDSNNSAGFGKGTDRRYAETFRGKVIPAGGVKARYVRLYSSGGEWDDRPCYTEVEVHGLPPEKFSTTRAVMVPSGWKPLRLQFPGPATQPASTTRPRDPSSKAADDPVIYVPPGTDNLALKMPVSSINRIAPTRGELQQITDGDKRPDAWVEVGPNFRWVQIDLREVCDIYAIVLWHRYDTPQRYKHGRIMVSTDRYFQTDVHDLFDNSWASKGEDPYYEETHRGRIIPAMGLKARFVRLESHGNSVDEMNHYTEVEVHGLSSTTRGRSK